MAGETRSYQVMASIRKGTEEMTYRLVSLEPAVGWLKAYELSKSDGPASYQVSLDNRGTISCTCPGWQHRMTCKHVDFCIHFGLLDPESERAHIVVRNQMNWAVTSAKEKGEEVVAAKKYAEETLDIAEALQAALADKQAELDR